MVPKSLKNERNCERTRHFTEDRYSDIRPNFLLDCPYLSVLKARPTKRSAIADKPRWNVGKLWQKQAYRPKCGAKSVHL